MATTDSESNELRSFLGWLLFLVLCALAVIGAFLVFDASDDGEPDLVPTTTAAPGPADDIDVAALRSALAGAGVLDPTVSIDGPRSASIGGAIPDEATRRRAIAAARSVVPDGVNLSSVFDLVVVEPEPQPAPEPEPEEAAPAFGTVDELASSIGMSPDDFDVDPDGTVVTRRGPWDTSVFTQFFGVDVVDYSASDRQAKALALLQAAGVEDASVTIDDTDPLRLGLHGVVPDDVEIGPIIAGVQDLAFVDNIAIDLSRPVPPADPVVTFTIENGIVTLTGTVADEATRAAVVAEAGRLFGAGNVVDEMVVGEVGPGALRLEGTVPDTQRDAVEAGLAGLADTLGLELQDDFAYTALSDDQAALQDQIAELADAIQINFASGSSALPADGPAQLDTLVDALAASPEGTTVAVEGHTDDQGEAASNQSLSEARAQAVLDYLVEAGVPADRLRAVGNGESQPIADNSTAEGRAANRRIDFNVVI